MCRINNKNNVGQYLQLTNMGHFISRENFIFRTGSNLHRFLIHSGYFAQNFKRIRGNHQDTKTALTITSLFMIGKCKKWWLYSFSLLFDVRKREGKEGRKRMEIGIVNERITIRSKEQKKKNKMNFNVKPVNFRLIFIEKPFRSTETQFFAICDHALSTFSACHRFLYIQNLFRKNSIDCSNNNQYFNKM